MAVEKHQVPPIPVPPIESAPVVAAPPAPTAPPAPPTATRPDPYAAPPQTQYAPPSPYGSPTPYGAPGAPYVQPYGYGPQAVQPPQGLAIASMVCGLAGVVMILAGFSFLPGIAAIVTGHLAQKRQPQARGFWITGLITGYVSAGIGLIIGLIVVVIFIAAIASSTQYSTY
jgi:hypothetical protein